MTLLEQLIANGNNGVTITNNFAEARALVESGDGEMWETSYCSGPGAVGDSCNHHVCLTDEASIKYGIYTAAELEEAAADFE